MGSNGAASTRLVGNALVLDGYIDLVDQVLAPLTPFRVLMLLFKKGYVHDK